MFLLVSEFVRGEFNVEEVTQFNVLCILECFLVDDVKVTSVKFQKRIRIQLFILIVCPLLPLRVIRTHIRTI